MTEIILTSSILILLLAALRRLLRGRIDPRVQYALWLLVAARLLIPGTLFTAPVSVMGAAEELRTSIRETFPDPGSVAVSPPAASPAVQPFPAAEPDEGAEVPAENIIPEPVFDFHWWDFVDWPDVIWKTGMAVTGGVMAASNLVFYLHLRRTRRRLDLPAAPWTGHLPVYEAEGLSSPCLFGLFRPAVYLNEAAMNTAHPEHVLAHEYAHYRHGDQLWSILRSICLVIHWYDPLVWWAAALCRRDCELACDASVLRQLGEAERIDYGQTLLGMVSRSRNPAALLHTATTMTAGKRAMTERIALIVKAPRTRKITLVLVVLLACVLAACTFGGGEAKAPEGTPSSPGPAEGQEMGIPVAVMVSQALSSNSNDTSYITDPEEVARLWEMYQSFEYEGAYDYPKEGGWPVTVNFYYGDTPDDRDVFFILEPYVFYQHGEYLRLKDIDEIYAELLRISEDPAYSRPVISGSDSSQNALEDNARSIVEQVQQGADVSEWLPLMNYMDWSVLARAAVEAGMDEGDGSGAAVEIMSLIDEYITRQGPSMTQAEYLYLLSATAGLDGAPAEGYADTIYQLYSMNPSQFAYVVLEMLPETQRNEALYHFCFEWYFHRGTEAPPTQEEAIAEAVAQLEADLEASVSATPSEETLYSAGSTFRFLLMNTSGIYALTYKSSDPGVAEVDDNGIVTATGPGEAVITMYYEGSGGPQEFTCQVRCIWEDVSPNTPAPAEAPNEPASAEPSFEVTNEWQRTFFGFVFSIPAMPDQELVYDSTEDSGLEKAVLSVLSDYYRDYVAQNGNSSHNDRFSRIILESDISSAPGDGTQLAVSYQVECLSEREMDGVTYPLVPQTGEHLATTFTVRSK